MSGTVADSGRNWPAAVALVVLTAVLALAVGPIGAVAGLATGLAWYASGTPYAVAAGHVVLASGFRTLLEPGTFAVVELAFLAFAAATTARTATLGRDVGVVLASGVGLLGVVWIGVQSQPLWIAAGTLLVVFALVAYALHRYELVSLGLVPDDPT